MNKYTIIIPVYNCEKYILRCINSIINQSYTNTQIIIVDDGSTDNTTQICDNCKEKDDRIMVIHVENGGVSKARNIGLKLAIGEYITFVDSDDYIDSNTIEIIDKIIMKKNVEIVKYGYYKEIGKIRLKNKFSVKTNEIIYKDLYKKEIEPYIYSTNDFGNIWNTFFKRKTIDNLFFDTSLKYSEDRKFMIEALFKSDSTFIYKPSMYHYISNNSSATNSISRTGEYLKLENTLRSNLDTYYLLDNTKENKKQILESISYDFNSYLLTTDDILNYEDYLLKIDNLCSKKEILKIMSEYDDKFNISVVKYIKQHDKFNNIIRLRKCKKIKKILKEKFIKKGKNI